MILGPKSLEKLRVLINEETEYRSGPQLVQFFNRHGFKDSYGPGFPSRWVFTDQKLEKLNGSPEIDKCIRSVLSPANFIGRLPHLDKCIADLNAYLAFDKWRVVRNGADIGFVRLDKVELNEDSVPSALSAEDGFLKREFANVPLAKIGLEGVVLDILELRVKEIETCFKAGAYLSVILMAGSTLEGIFLGLSNRYPKQFNMAQASPRDATGKVAPFHKWTLNAFIDVAKELQLIQYDTHKFSHSLRDFRNYIHPFEQMASGFTPREHTAKICLQVLRAAIHEICENKNGLVV